MRNPGRILLDLRCLQDDKRFHGIGRYARTIVEYLVEQPPSDFQILGLIYDRIGRIRTWPLNAVLSRAPQGGFIESIFMNPRFRRRYATWAFASIRMDLDVVHFLDQNSCPYFFRGRSIVTVHDIAGALSGPWMRSERTRKIEDLYFRNLFRWAEEIVCVSEFTAKEVRKHFGIDRPLRIIASPLRLREGGGDSAGPARKSQFLFLAGLDPRKNPENMFQAFQIFRRRGYGDYRLLVAGQFAGRDYRRVCSFMTDLGGLERIKFLGFVPDPELERLMRESRALLFATLYEGFGYPAVEAMARGLPVIASTGGSVAEISRNACFCVDPQNPEEIADAMERLVTSPSFERTLIDQGHHAARSLAGTAPLEGLVGLYRQVLQKASDRQCQ